VQEPQVRTILEWKPADLRSALALSEAGNLQLVSDLGAAIMRDDRVGAALGVRVLGMLSLPLSFTPADDSDRAQRVASALSEDWGLISQGLPQVLSWSIMLGVGLAVVEWVEGPRRTPKLHPWSPRWLRWSEGQWWLELPDEGKRSAKPPDWLIAMPYGEHAPWRHGAWQRCAIPWLVKAYAVQDWARYSEVHGTPARIGRKPPGASREEADRFARDLQQLGTNTSIVLPEGWNLELLEAKAATHETFQQQIEWADKALTIALLGQHLTTEVKGASLAAARVHEEVRADILRADAEATGRMLRNTLLAWWAEANFGDATLAPWPVWDTALPGEAKERAQQLFELGRAVMMWSQAGAPLDVVAIAEREGVPLLQQQQAPVPARRVMRSPGGASGFVAGQVYADQLTENASRQAMAVFHQHLRDITEAVNTAQDYEDLRRRLLALFGQMDPTVLAEIVERSLILAELAGHWAVWKDHGGTKREP